MNGLAQKIEGTYNGDVVSSDSKQVIETAIEVKKLSEVLVKVDFSLAETDYSFRGMLTEQKEGTLMIVQEKVGDEFILSGVSGFIYKKPNVHGGFVNQLNSFFFHIILDTFSGGHKEVYFLGQKPTEKRDDKVRADQLFQTVFSDSK